MTRVWHLLSLIMLTVGGCAQPTDRVALVIGVEHYQALPRLTMPASDTELITTKLRELGFEVIRVINPDHTEMRLALHQFGHRLAEGKARVGLFYFSGHGLQVDGTNYLLSIDDNPTQKSDLPNHLVVSVKDVFDQMDVPRVTKLVFLDACRVNPFAGALGGVQGLAPMQARSDDSLVVYATAPGDTAADRSPFTRALASHIADPNLDIWDMVREVRLEVQEQTKARTNAEGKRMPQVPYEASSLVHHFYVKVVPEPP